MLTIESEGLAIEEKENIELKGVPTVVNSLRIHANKDRGQYLLLHDGKSVIDQNYHERNTIFYNSSKYTLVRKDTQLEIEEEIKKLSLKEVADEKTIDTPINPISR